MNDHLFKIARRINLHNLPQFTKDLASLSQNLRLAERTERGILNTTTQSPHFQRGSGILNHTGGTYSESVMIDFPSSFYGKESWKNFLIKSRTEVCARPADSQITMLGIKEVEMAKSIVELVTSRSITGQHDFLEFDLLDAMFASALMKPTNTQSSFRKESVSKSNELKV